MSRLHSPALVFLIAAIYWMSLSQQPPPLYVRSSLPAIAKARDEVERWQQVAEPFSLEQALATRPRLALMHRMAWPWDASLFAAWACYAILVAMAIYLFFHEDFRARGWFSWFLSVG